jgi:hypothetical protein
MMLWIFVSRFFIVFSLFGFLFHSSGLIPVLTLAYSAHYRTILNVHSTSEHAGPSIGVDR